MPTMQDIEARTKAFSEARQKLATIVAELEDALANLRRNNLPRVKRQLNRVAELQALLEADIAAAPELFTKPRTVVLHGVKVGFEKGKGAVTFDDADKVVELIRKKLPDLADVLIKTEHSPIKKALANLTVQQLKSVGAQVEEAGDRVVVRAVDGAVDKLVTALLKGATDEARSEADATAEA
jgi:hypothetical protein